MDKALSHHINVEDESAGAAERAPPRSDAAASGSSSTSIANPIIIRTTAKIPSIHDVSKDLYDRVLTPSNCRLIHVFNAEWDDEGVFFYQAYRDEIADYAVEHQNFGGEQWNPSRMTWIKPSFGWVLYRSGYGRKSGQERILKVKLGHAVLAELLCQCKLAHEKKHGVEDVGGTTKPLGDKKNATKISFKHGNFLLDALEGDGCFDTTNIENRSDSIRIVSVGGKGGRIQWDPERDMSQPETLNGIMQPRKLNRTRAIQIGLSAELSEYYVENALSVEDVTDLAHTIKVAHETHTSHENKESIPLSRLPKERPYMPALSVDILVKLGMLPTYIEEWR